MSFVRNENQQLRLDDSLNNLTAREQCMLRKSWAEGFSNIVFPAINEQRFSVLYSDKEASRPNTPVNVIIGALLIKEMFGFTDEELVEGILFNVQYQHALRTTSFLEQPISDRTLSRFRERVYRYALEHNGRDLIYEEMCELAEVYAKYMKISPSVKRMDSAMVSSSCRRLSRLSLMYLTVRKMVDAVKRDGQVTLPEELLIYAKDAEHDDVGYRLSREQVAAKMEEILVNALHLADICSKYYSKTDEYRRLLRMIEDQSKEVSGTRVLKENKEIVPTSMQNPSDEDATYREKAGKGHVGYAVNLVETCSENGNLVTDYDYQPNTYSDPAFAEDVLKAMTDENDTDVLITDGAFGSVDNLILAEEKGVVLAATTLCGGVTDDFEAQFEIDEESNSIIRCPAGHAPLDCKYSAKKGYRAHFDKKTCESCPHCERCPGIFQKKTALIRFTNKAVIRAQYFRKMGTEEYKNYARQRNGVEGVPSVLRRRYGIDHMPVRGLLRSKIWVGFKIGAMNTVRLLKSVINPNNSAVFSCVLTFITSPSSPYLPYLLPLSSRSALAPHLFLLLAA